MAENYLFGEKKKSSTSWLVKLILFISFVWISLYTSSTSLTTELYWNFGNLLDFSSENSSSIISVIFVEALVYWLAFEVVFYLYRFVLQFKIYSFVVPQDKLKNESRIFYIYRNVFYGVFLNLCFLFPYLYVYAPFISLVSTFVMLLIYANHLNKTYAEPIIGHFVFKNFCYPIFVYQAIVLLVDIIGVF
ncbi:MAG: hypothetical protein IKD36_03090 [Clostridia bacterium]|nr:hypothetical protein [Clostridia bacterium]